MELVASWKDKLAGGQKWDDQTPPTNKIYLCDKCVIQVALPIQERNYLFSNNPLKDFNNGRSE